jgi:hypothetical protein
MQGLVIYKIATSSKAFWLTSTDFLSINIIAKGKLSLLGRSSQPESAVGSRLHQHFIRNLWAPEIAFVQFFVVENDYEACAPRAEFSEPIYILVDRQPKACANPQLTGLLYSSACQPPIRFAFWIRRLQISKAATVPFRVSANST